MLVEGLAGRDRLMLAEALMEVGVDGPVTCWCHKKVSKDEKRTEGTE